MENEAKQRNKSFDATKKHYKVEEKVRYPKLAYFKYENSTGDYREMMAPTGYKAQEFINTAVERPKEIGDKIEKFSKAIQSDKDFEGMKLVLHWHGSEQEMKITYNDWLEYEHFGRTLSLAKNFLEIHPDAKLYIENNACLGRDQLDVMEDIRQSKANLVRKNLYQLLEEYFGEYKDRIYIRSVKKDYVHHLNFNTNKDLYIREKNPGEKVNIFAKVPEKKKTKQEESIEKYNEKERKNVLAPIPIGQRHKGCLQKNEKNAEKKKDHRPQTIRNANTFKYFPLNDWKNCDDPKYSGYAGKKKKNKALNFTKNPYEPNFPENEYSCLTCSTYKRRTNSVDKSLDAVSAPELSLP